MIGNIAWGGRALRIAVGITMLVLLLAGGAGAATITVNASGVADYTRIQDAVNAANTGDTINVQSGTYYENVNVNKQLILKGVDTGIGKPVVDAGGAGSAINISMHGVNLEGFNAINSSKTSNDAGINVNSNNNVISDNVASNNYFGILVKYSSNNTILGNILTNNGIFIYHGGGQYAIGGGGIRIIYPSVNNTLIDNNASSNQYFGIETRASSNNTLNGNIANFNKYYGIYLYSDGNNTLIGNTAVFNNYTFPSGAQRGTGIELENTGNNTLKDNNISGNILFGINLYGSNDNILINNTASNNRANIKLTSSTRNNIYNNFFSNINANANSGFTNPILGNNWNTTKLVGTNIAGGPHIGGNFWANPSGTGFSQICTDADRDGICDTNYALNSLNIDYLPLAVPDIKPPIVRIISPQNKPHNSTIIPLNVSADEAITIWNYSLNGGINVTFTPNTTITASQGANNLIVYAMDLAGNWNSSTVSFSVDSLAPIIIVASPQNIIYNAISIPLNVSANEAISTWRYSLNGALNVTFVPNTTITAVEGSNSVIVYANDTANNWNSSQVNFNVDTSVPVIILTGANPQIIEVGAVYIELGATVSDTNDAGLVATINSSAVNTNVVGTYYVTYDTVDPAGNHAIQVKRTVIVTAASTYNLSGYVFDNFGAGLEGAIVQNDSITVITELSGYYSITGLLNGTYNFSYSKAGFDTNYLEITIGGANVVNANKTIYDTTPPAIIKALANVSYAQTYINWTWTNPTDLDFNHVDIYVDFDPVISVDKAGFYNATGFTPNTQHTIHTRTVDNLGNVNATWKNHTATTASVPDTSAPASVTGLTNITYAQNYINWTWTDPADIDFDHVEVYLDGIQKPNVLAGVRYYNATVAPGTYTIGTRTVDTDGNINATMVTHTATTILPPIRFINGTVMDSVSKAVIPGMTVSTGSLSTTTNATGFYSLAVGSGSYDLTATFDIRYYTNSSITVSTVGNAVVVKDIELVKKPIGNITGSVTKSL